MTSPTLTERVARAMEPSAFATYDRGYTNRNGFEATSFLNAERTVKSARRKARAAIEAMRYEDGLDEDRLIACCVAERLECVSAACFWDRMIDAALAEGQTSEKPPES